MKIISNIMLILLLLVFMLPAVMAEESVPSGPNIFEGSVQINDSDATVGTVIEVYIDYTNNKVPDGSTTVDVEGDYEIYVYPNSNDDIGKEVTFKVTNIDTAVSVFKNGPIVRHLNLTAYDTTPPTIDSPTVAYPEGKSIVKNGDTVTVSANVTDEGSQVETVSLDVSAINSSASDVVMQEDDGTTYDWNDNSAADAGLYGATVVVNTENNGEQALSIEAVDYVGNNNSSEVGCNVDNTPPIAVLDDPLDNSLLKNNEITFNFSLTDNLDDSVDWTLYIDGVENASGTGLDEISETVSGLSKGVHTWNVSVEDSAGNTNVSTTHSFTVDTEKPTITLDTIEEADYFNDSTVWINGTYNDNIVGVDNSTLEVQVNGIVPLFETMLNDTDSFNYSLTLDDKVDHNVTIGVDDNLGNSNTTGVVNFTVDTIEPTLTLDTIQEDDEFNYSKVWINGTFSDDISNVNNSTLVITVNDTPYDYDAIGEASISSSDYNFSLSLSDADNNVTVSISDHAGNTNTTGLVNFSTDITPPAIDLDSISEGVNFKYSTVWINGTYSDNVVGVDNSTLVISVNNTDTSFESMMDDTDSFNYSLSLPDGEHNVTIDVADNVGNDATQVLKNFSVDTEGHTLTLDTIEEGDYFTDSTVWINGTFSDDTSGINTSTLEILVNGTSVDSINIVGSSSYNHSINLEDAEHNVTVSVENNVGHSSTTGPVNFSVDTMPPTTDNNAPKEPAENPFTITFQPLDNNGGSGVNATFYRIDDGEWIIGDSIDIYEAGEYTIEFYSDDIAGNEESTKTITVNLTESDTVAPVTTDDAPSGWQNESFTVNLSAIDEGGSGVNKTLYRMGDDWLSGTSILIDTPGNHTIEYYSIDKAGNEETSNVTYAKYDPDVPGMNEQNITPKLILNTSTDTAIVTVNVTDQVSGLDNVTIDLTPIGESVFEMVSNGNNIYSYSISTTHPAGDFSFNVTAIDNAGNSANKPLKLNVSTSYEAITEYSGEDGEDDLSTSDIDQAIEDNEAGEVSDETVLVLIEEYFS
ncbi:hypothetical protein MPF_1638 [Methanohalophilus portucalensis FDF-1]|nr:hypothetical protein MPF_1638 [Methanohalophilus portucalensis FDF-1]